MKDLNILYTGWVTEYSGPDGHKRPSSSLDGIAVDGIRKEGGILTKYLLTQKGTVPGNVEMGTEIPSIIGSSYSREEVSMILSDGVSDALDQYLPHAAQRSEAYISAVEVKEWSLDAGGTLILKILLTSSDGGYSILSIKRSSSKVKSVRSERPQFRRLNK